MDSIFDRITRNFVPWYKGGLSEDKLLKRKEISVPESFNGVKDFDNASHGYFPVADNTVKCDLWREELHSVCVTLVLDGLLDKYGDGDLYFVIDERDINIDNYINLGIVEMISSGIRYEGSFSDDGYDVMKLAVTTSHNKAEIKVPSDVFRGFKWYKSEYEPGQDMKMDIVPVSAFGGKTILNFAVCGEFNLSVYFSPSANPKIIPLFSKSFCCK